MLRTIGALLLMVFSVETMALPLNTANKEKRAKKMVSKYVAQIHATSQAEKKEEMLADFLHTFERQVLSQDVTAMSEEDAEELTTLKENLLGGFEMVKGSSAEELDAFASYVESEINQASVQLVIWIMFVTILFLAGRSGF